MSETLYSCPRCYHEGFTARGLKAHQCRGAFGNKWAKSLAPADLARAESYSRHPQSKTNPAQVIVHHRGDANHARCGIGKSSASASSTSDGFYAAEAAARKYFGPGSHIALVLVKSGSMCTSTPTLYTAEDKRACRKCERWHMPACDAVQKDLCANCAKGGRS